MSDKEKLDIACKFLHDAIKKNVVRVSDEENMKLKWKALALRGSVQTRKAKVLRRAF